MKNFKFYHIGLLALCLLFQPVSIVKIHSQELPQKELDWYNLSPTQDKVYGIGVNEAYRLLQGRKAKPITVALIGSGIDLMHEDYQTMLWQNKKEKLNGKDDDGNGLVDDVHGWNFLGGIDKDGTTIAMTSTMNQGDREYFRLREKYADYISDGKRFFRFQGDEMVEVAPPANVQEYHYYRDTIVYESPLASRYAGILAAKMVKHYTKVFDKKLKERFPGQEITQKEFETLYDKNAPKDLLSDMAFMILGYSFPLAKTNSWKKIYDVEMAGTPIKQAQQEYETYLQKHSTDNRQSIVGDDPYNLLDNHYGNADLLTEDANVGTMEASIIAAIRGNGKGADGICNAARIMPLRATTAGDPYLKDVALTIRYAVDHGAKVMLLPSQNTLFPPVERKWIADALYYAEQHDVLAIVPVTESAQDLQKTTYYPNRKMIAGHELTNLMIVAPSDKLGKPSLKANYGKTELDIHAPGKEIYSAGVGNTYGLSTGTGMAAATLAGAAALVRSYFPKLTAAEVRELLNNTATPMQDMEIEKTIVVNDRKVNDLFTYSDISISGGIVNVANAVKKVLQEKNSTRK